MSTLDRIVVASANPDKVREIEVILRDALGDTVALLARPREIPDIDETGRTLEENARLKAAGICRSTGIAAIADDTGLEVEALDGAPGVYSARYAGPEADYRANVAKLLRALAETTDRRARFRTVAMLVLPDGTELSAEGSVLGEIAPIARGEGGFGYDSVFVPSSGDGRTYAEMSVEEKNALSHRGKAFRALSDVIRARWS
jgi:XTP/dITP diphosphohydrolase